jgi:hypothetical protein
MLVRHELGTVELPEGERALVRVATVSGGIGAAASAVLSAAVSDDRGRAFFLGATAGWIVFGAAGYLYTQWRIRKAIESILP